MTDILRQKKSTLLFVTGMVASCLLVLPLIIDVSLVPRFAVLSAVCGAFLLFNRVNVLSILKDNGILMLFALFAVWNVASIAWSIDKPEAMFSAGKAMT